MSKPSLTGREQQQSSPSGLGHKQAKKQKIRRKCATVAPYLMFYRFLCNALQRASQKAKKYGANAPYLHHIFPADVQRQMGANYIDNDEPLCFTDNGTPA